jgi:ISXO2-like transposase domain
VKFGQRVVAPGSTIRTDGARQLRRFADLGYKHEYFTELGSDVPAHVNMPAVHMAASQLKRWIDGTLHQGVSREQLAYYLDGFTFRLNRRTSASRGLLFYRLLRQCTNLTPRNFRLGVCWVPWAHPRCQCLMKMAPFDD